MREDDVAKIVRDGLIVRREDIARAKDYVLSEPADHTDEMAGRWLKAQKADTIEKVDYYATDCEEAAERIARMYSMRLAFYRAVWELVTSGEIVPFGQTQEWQPRLGYKTSHGSGGINLPDVKFPYPSSYHRIPDGSTTDPDVFLRGIDCKSLHDGIKEAIEQSLGCFRRGLYMPATVMLAAAAEATWIECGVAVANKLGNKKLDSVVDDQLASISKKVTAIRKALEQPNGKELLKEAGQHFAKVTDAEVWTTTLRDRRNALHWGKAKSFISDHSETGTLLMAAPLHLGTLEKVRGAC